MNDDTVFDKQNENDLKVNVEYLQMIQSAIDRMSTSSAIFKGFAAAIVAGVSAISLGDVSLIVIILSFIPVMSFMMMDVYYLQLGTVFLFWFFGQSSIPPLSNKLSCAGASLVRSPIS